MADALEELLAQQAAQAAPGSVDPLEAMLAAQSNPQPLGNEANHSLATPVVPKAPRTLAEEGQRQLGLTARAGVTGLTGLPVMAGDALNSGINLGIIGANKLGANVPLLPRPSATVQQWLTDAGAPEPETRTEKNVFGATSAMAGVAPSTWLGRLLSAYGATPSVQAFGTGMQTAPGVQTAGAAGAGAAASEAANQGYGPLVQTAAAVAGGLAGAGAGQGARGVFTKTPTKAQVIAQAERDMANNEAPTPVKPRYKMTENGPVEIEQPAPVGKPAISPETPVQPIPDPVKATYGVQDQLKRIQTLKKLGLQEQRPSTISGDSFESGQEFQNSKLTNPLGEVTRAQLEKEQQALRTFADNIVGGTGARAGTPAQVGQTIRAPMKHLSDFFDTAVTKLYAAAREKAGEAGTVDPKNLNGLLKDQNWRESLLASPEGTSLLGALERQIKRFQGAAIEGEEPSLAPNSVNSAENLRQWLNAQWSPRNSALIGKVKEALDLDVANAGGSGLFDKARKLHGLRKDTLDNPNGIAKLLDESGPNNVNQAIPDEAVGSKVAAMPLTQFKHIISTLNNLPPSLKEYGAQAIAEIKGQFARELRNEGARDGGNQNASMWNAGNVNRYLNANRDKMSLLFTPGELENFRTLHDAGYILKTPTAYPGAAAQGYNYLMKGAIGLPPLIGSGIGMATGIPGAESAGLAAGSGAAWLTKNRIDNSMATRYADLLRNPTPKVPQK